MDHGLLWRWNATAALGVTMMMAGLQREKMGDADEIHITPTRGAEVSRAECCSE